MKKFLIVFSGVCFFIILLYITYTIYLSRIDTKYAIDFSNAFAQYDIDCVDNYLSEDTEIIFRGSKKTYKELRNNVIIACNNKRYSFTSSYGHGNDKFTDDVQKIKVYLFGKLDSISIGEVNISMKLQREGLFDFKIISLECDDPIFGHIFYGVV